MRMVQSARLATKVIAAIIGNSDYSERRLDDGFENFCDLDEVKTDMLNVLEGVENLGARS